MVRIEKAPIGVFFLVCAMSIWNGTPFKKLLLSGLKYLRILK